MYKRLDRKNTPFSFECVPQVSGFGSREFLAFQGSGPGRTSISVLGPRVYLKVQGLGPRAFFKVQVWGSRLYLKVQGSGPRVYLKVLRLKIVS